MSDVAVAPLSVQLRETTREVHERVEHASAINRLVVVRVPDPAAAASAAERTERTQARADYREVYRAFLVSAHGFEAAVGAALAASPALAAARASGWSEEAPTGADLARADLAEVFGTPAATGLPVPGNLPAPQSLAEFAGMEYVRRGSRAGGAVIGAVVAHNLGFTAESGARFLLRYGKGTRAMLVDFRAWLDGLPLGADEVRAALDSAAATFAAVERWHRVLDLRG